jgi:hypothetical protein
MRREMQQLAALMEAAAAGEAWAAEPAPDFAEDRITVAWILGPSRDPIPLILWPLAGAAGFALGGWPLMLGLPTLGALLLSRRTRDATRPWLEARAARELAAALPRFLHARLLHFDGTALRRGQRIAASGVGLIRGPDGAPILVLVQEGFAARVPWGLIRGWAWQLGAQRAAGGPAPPVPMADGLWLNLADAAHPLWHVALADPELLHGWAGRLDASPGSLWAGAPTRETKR